jgi:hypothetical protein
MTRGRAFTRFTYISVALVLFSCFVCVQHCSTHSPVHMHTVVFCEELNCSKVGTARNAMVVLLSDVAFGPSVFT